MTELTLIANSANFNPAINFVLLSFGMQHAETIQKSMTDTYLTIDQPGEAIVTEKKSKFLSFAYHVESADEAKQMIESVRKKYYDARHVCWAYMLGRERTDYRSNDDGEPSGTAGRPILGQINSAELTDVLIIVVRYFGGTLLGTSGLIKAYREAAASAIANAQIVQKTVDDVLHIRFGYDLLNEVMRVLKQFDEVQWEQQFAEDCRMQLRIRRSLSQKLLSDLSVIYGVEVLNATNE
jgi:uncharacterized YigZ family protein